MPSNLSLPTRTFFNKIVEDKSNKNFSKRGLWLEKGFLFKEEATKYGEEVMSVIHTHR